jgi:single-strand DNA-binding protein
MPNLNQVNLIGHITRDPDVRYTPQGTQVVDLGLAINRVWKDSAGEKKEETTFVDITLWGKTAEVASQYCHKGDPLFVSGRLSLDTWDDKQTGQKRSKLKVVGEQIQLLGARQQAAAPTTKPAAPAPSPRPTPTAAARPAAAKSQPTPDRDLDPATEPDDCPF